MRVTLVSNLVHQVAFSFEPDGLIYISKDRFFVDGNMRLEYSRLDSQYSKVYTRDDAFHTPVFIYSNTGNMFLSQQPENTIFEIDITPKREVLIEKNGSYLKNEFKRLKNDPVYFYLKYCEIRH